MTLAEVLIAVVLLAFVVMTSLIALSQAFGYVRHARMVTLSSQILQSVMEDLRLKNFGALRAYAAQAQPVDLSAALASERFTSNFTTGFSIRAEFSTLVASLPSQPGKIGVRVTVSWTEASGAFTRSTVSYFGEQGLSDYIYVGWAP